MARQRKPAVAEALPECGGHQTFRFSARVFREACARAGDAAPSRRKAAGKDPLTIGLCSPFAKYAKHGGNGENIECIDAEHSRFFTLADQLQ